MGADWRIEVCLGGGGGGEGKKTSHTLNYKILSCLYLRLAISSKKQQQNRFTFLCSCVAVVYFQNL